MIHRKRELGATSSDGWLATLSKVWPPIVACLVGLVAVTADLFLAPFRTFALNHAMITALVSMGIFAVLTAWFVDWLAAKRERKRRSSVTGNAVRVTADMAWDAVSHAGMGWPNLRYLQVREEVLRCLRAYNSQVAILALTPNVDDAFFALLDSHDRLGAALDSFFLSEPMTGKEESEKFEEIRQLQAKVDAASWTYIKPCMPTYWDDPERFTPPFTEPPPWYLMMPRCPKRTSPLEERAEGTASTGEPMVNLGSDVVGSVIHESVGDQDFDWQEEGPLREAE